MCEDERAQDGMFGYVSLQKRVPQDHPLRAVRKLTDQVLRWRSGEFDGCTLRSVARLRRSQGFCSHGAGTECDPACYKEREGARCNLERRTTRQPGYAISLSRRWLVEKGFG